MGGRRRGNRGQTGTEEDRPPTRTETDVAGRDVRSEEWDVNPTYVREGTWGSHERV